MKPDRTDRTDRTDRVDVAIVGGGPAGLTAATELRRRSAGSVCVLEREPVAGGIPRHADHPGFGLRDLQRSLSGPPYARCLTDRAQAAGVELRTGTQVTGWNADRELELTGPDGRTTLAARAIVLATGCRERPCSARFIPGTRPQGVMTSDTLQQLVHLEHQPVGRRALVVGAEHVSFSALATLDEAGTRTVEIITVHPRHQSFAAFALGATVRYRARLRTRAELSEIVGSLRAKAVAVTDLDTGVRREIPCDAVVLTADWIPDHELAVAVGALLDPGTSGPVVDSRLRTSQPGLFAAGSLLHGAEPADVAALSGRTVVGAVLDHPRGAPWPPAAVPVSCEPPLHWIVPNRIVPGESARSFLLRARELLHDVRLEVVQDGRVLARRRLPRVMPGRSARLGAGWVAEVDPAGPAVHVRVGSARHRTQRRAERPNQKTGEG
jgi:thioredoxin reductase